MELNIPKINVQAETVGIWSEFIPGIKFKVARSNNKNYVQKMIEFRDEFQHLIDKGEMSNDDAGIKLAEATASTILMDWEGIEESGSPIPYTVESGVEMLLDPRYRDAAVFIERKSLIAANYYEDEKEKQGEELPTTMDG